jgi:hypothetical protein
VSGLPLISASKNIADASRIGPIARRGPQKVRFHRNNAWKVPFVNAILPRKRGSLRRTGH